MRKLLVLPLPGHIDSPSNETGDHRARHLEVVEDPKDRLEHCLRALLEHLGGYSPIEHEVMILVGGDPSHECVCRLIIGQSAGIAMTDGVASSCTAV